VFDADERFQGSERYSMIDVTRTVPDLSGFGMVLIDPPFSLGWEHLAPLLKAARRRPLLVSATDWCVACAGWGELFASYRLSQVTAYFPRYRSISNGYCESTLKRDGRTNISFYSNIPFAPPRRPVVLKQGGSWTTFDPYEFRERHTSAAPPNLDEPTAVAADDPAVAAATAKALELRERWGALLPFRRVPWRRRLKRLVRFGM
jgi:hypothetical protein